MNQIVSMVLFIIVFVVSVAVVSHKLMNNDIENKRKEVCYLGKKTFIFNGYEYRCGGSK